MKPLRLLWVLPLLLQASLGLMPLLLSPPQGLLGLPHVCLGQSLLALGRTQPRLGVLLTLLLPLPPQQVAVGVLAKQTVALLLPLLVQPSPGAPLAVLLPPAKGVVLLAVVAQPPLPCQRAPPGWLLLLLLRPAQGVLLLHPPGS